MMDHEGLQFDFLSPNPVPTELKEKFSLIGKVIEVPNRKKRLLDYCMSLSKLLKRNKYDVVHIHGNSGTMCIESVIAKKQNVNRVIVHCHNTVCNHPFFNKLMRPIMLSKADCLLSCSQDAGKWLYGKSGYHVLNNAIDTEKFRFNGKTRMRIREELKINDEFVLGHVGHFTEQKNHTFLLDLFAEIVKEIPNTKLLLVGDGPELENISKKVSSLGLQKTVIFAGKTENPENMYFAMDMFLFPSKWEGLGLVLIEAQASGLQCITSNNVPREGNITGNVNFINYNYIEKWKNYIINYVNSEKEHRSITSDKNIVKIRQYNYDIRAESYKLKKIYNG
jgi:glycosyltransferase involved in cell wall biosynthesis